MRQAVQKTYIIAEAGVNHNGDIGLARRLVMAAAGAGADAVKFQTFKAEKLASAKAPKADYQNKTTDAGESQLDMLKRLELPLDAYAELIELCRERGIDFLSTPFEEESLSFLVNECKLPLIKIPSGEITNGPFLLSIARTGLPVILSTGMSTLADIENALAVLAYGYLRDREPQNKAELQLAYIEGQNTGILREKVQLLHCTTEYPAPFEEINLAAMDAMREAFGLRAGYSDHTEGIAVPLAAVARGAVIIEKHFTLDKEMPGPDHKASLEPDELKAMVEGIRQIEQAVGSGFKLPGTSEQGNMEVVRKSLIAARTIKKGDLFTKDNIAVKRPGNGISPMNYWDCLGRRADRDYAEEELIL